MAALNTRLARIVEALRSHGPEYQPLVEVLTEPCQHPNAAWRDSAPLRAFCPTCHVETDESPYHLPDARVPRTWSNLPDGALVGPVWKATRRSRDYLAGDPSDWGCYCGMKVLMMETLDARWADDINGAVVAVLELCLGLEGK